MRPGRRPPARAALMSTLLALVGCAAHVDGESEGSATAALGENNTLFPGDPGCSGRPCERVLRSPSLFIPETNGRPWDDTYALGAGRVEVAAGYSSGRIALLRRLMFLPEGQRTAVLLDPSYPDGVRDFGRGRLTGSEAWTTGPEIVSRWLRADPSRRFVLIHSPWSAGHAEYRALQSSDVGARVRVCSVAANHLDVPRVVGTDAIVGATSWDNGTCTWGSGSAGAQAAGSECARLSCGGDVGLFCARALGGASSELCSCSGQSARTHAVCARGCAQMPSGVADRCR